MTHSSAVALTDQEVLKRIQLLGDALVVATAPERAGRASPPKRSPSPQEGWTHQVTLLEELALLFSDDVASRAAFVGWVSLYLKNSLFLTLQSRRSAVALATMAALKCLMVRSATSSRAAVATVCSWFLTRLVRLAASTSTSSSVADTAMSLLLSMAGSCLLTLEGLNTICTDCAAMSAAVRRCAIQVLQAYLQAARGTAYQLSASAYTAALHHVLRNALTDADAEVRASARTCFWALRLLEPTSAQSLLRVLPLAVRRHLAEERGRALDSLHAVVAGSNTSTAAGASAVDQKAKVAQRSASSAAVEPSSRTLTLQDELQAAVASRARAHSSRTPSPRHSHRQLLLMAKDLSYDPDSRPVPVRDFPPGQRQRFAPPRQTSLVAAMESTDWSVRRAALLQARRQCESGSLSHDGDALLAALLLRLQDTHFRVIEAAQDCLRCCLRVRPAATQEAMTSFLSVFMGALLRNTNHAKPTIANGALLLLDMLLQQQDVSAPVVLQALLHSVDDAQGVAEELRAAELLVYFVLSFPSLFTQESMVGAVLRSALAHNSTVPQADSATALVKAVRAAWCCVVGAVAATCADVFGDAVQRLSPPQRDVVLKCLADCFNTPQERGRSSANRFAAQDGAADPHAADVVIPCAFAQRLAVAYAQEEKKERSARSSGRGAVPPVSTEQRGRKIAETRGLRVSTIPPLLRNLIQSLHLPEADAQPQGSDATTPQTATEVSAAADIVAADTQITTAASSPTAALTFSKDAERTSDALFANDRRTQSPRYDEEERNIHVVAAEQSSKNETTLRLRDAPARFFREWTICHDAASKRAALTQLATSLRQLATRQRGTVDDAAGEAMLAECAPEQVERLLLLWEREAGSGAYGSDHMLRWSVFFALEALLGWPAARSPVARQLTRVLHLCRLGVDDAFVEVQLQASACLHAAVFATKFPTDLCLSALASCVAKWREGPSRDAATPGWLEMLCTMRTLLQNAQTVSVKGVKGSAATPKKDGGSSSVCYSSVSLTFAVLRRVVASLSLCLDHCNPVVRLSAVLVLAVLQATIGDAASTPFLKGLTAAQQRVVCVYTARIRTDSQEC